MKVKCIICNEFTQGRGQYRFKYLDEEVFLCGHHAQKVMNIIKELKEKKE